MDEKEKTEVLLSLIYVYSVSAFLQDRKKDKIKKSRKEVKKMITDMFDGKYAKYMDTSVIDMEE